jgi:hypothetical protein
MDDVYEHIYAHACARRARETGRESEREREKKKRESVCARERDRDRDTDTDTDTVIVTDTDTDTDTDTGTDTYTCTSTGTGSGTGICTGTGTGTDNKDSQIENLRQAVCGSKKTIYLHVVFHTKKHAKHTSATHMYINCIYSKYIMSDTHIHTCHRANGIWTMNRDTARAMQVLI